MFCNRCRIEFDPWLGRWGNQENRYCRLCHQKTWDAPKTLRGIDHYCIHCGKTLPKIKRKTKSGNAYLTSAHSRYCEKCKPIPAEKQPRKCVVCGSADIGRAHKYCPAHKPPLKYKINPVINRRTSIAWQKNNPEKVRASVMARYRSDMVSVLYECRCDQQKKHNHHFDYKFPMLVIRLCPACHTAEHARLRSLSAQAVAI